MIAIRKHFKDFLAVIGLILVAGAVSVYILGNQRMRSMLMARRSRFSRGLCWLRAVTVPGSRLPDGFKFTFA